MARVFLALLLAFSFIAGPVTGAQAAQSSSAPCDMHMDHASPAAPHPIKTMDAHTCKSCLGCAPAPAAAAEPGALAYPSVGGALTLATASHLLEGRNPSPDPRPPRSSL